MGIRRKVQEYLKGVKAQQELNRAVMASSIGCSVYQISRQAGDLVKEKKESLKSVKSVKSVKTSESDLILNELKKINKRMDSLEKTVKKIQQDDWIVYDGYIPPRGSKVKVKMTGGGVTVVDFVENLDWATYESDYDREYNLVYGWWCDYLDEKSHGEALLMAEKIHPESVNYDLSKSAEYNGLVEGDDHYEKFNVMKRDFERIVFEKKSEIVRDGFEEFMSKEFKAPCEDGYIESYKILDDSNEKVLKAVNKVLDQLKTNKSY